MQETAKETTYAEPLPFMERHDILAVPGTRSRSVIQLAAALAKAQADIQGAKKDSTNPFFSSRYADLASVWEAIRGPLTKNGLSVLQFPEDSWQPPENHAYLDEDGKSVDDWIGTVRIRTVLLHETGQFYETSICFPCKWTPQGVGAAITYGRRYSLQAVAGVAPEEDDAESAMPSNRTSRPGATRRPDTTARKATTPDVDPEGNPITWTCAACGAESLKADVPQFKARKPSPKYGLKIGDLAYRCGHCGEYVPQQDKIPVTEPDPTADKLPF